MKFLLKFILINFGIVLSFYLIISRPYFANAIINGMSATDLLGQYDQTSYTNPAPIYTKAGYNDGPNKFGFNTQYDVEIDTTNHRFFVSDTNNHRVLVYNLNVDNTFPDRIPDNVLGQVDFTSSSAVTTQSGMSNPRGLAYDATNNRLFVAQAGNNRVTVYDVTVINNGENAVNVLGQINFTASSGANTQSGMSGPRGLAYDATNNRLFVSQVNNHRVTTYDVTVITDGENAVNVLGQLNFTASAPANTQAGMSSPHGLAYDSANSRLFVAQSNHRVTTYDVTVITDGENAVNVLGQLNFTASAPANTQAGMSSPYGLAYDSANNRLFVSQTANHRVTTYDVTVITDGENAVNVLGQLNFTSSTSATTQAGMYNPFGLAYDATNSRLFVSQISNNRITTYDVTAITDGENAVDLLGQYDQTSFTDPVPLYTKGGYNDGSNKFGFNVPRDTAIDTTNHRFFVSDTDNHRVLVYNLNVDNTFPDRIPDNVLGQPNFSSSSIATTQSGMSNPYSLVYDTTNNRLFVAESGNNRVTVYNVTTITDGENAINVLGQVDFTSSSFATTQDGMNTPYGLTYDATNSRLFVSDYNNNRVTVYDVTTITDGENAINVLGQIDFISSSSATSQEGMYNPVGLTYDSTNNKLFVGDYNNNRVLVYDVASITDGENAENVLGQMNFNSGISVATQSGMSNPYSLTYDSINKRLFVVDSGNNRIMVFDFAPPTLSSFSSYPSLTSSTLGWTTDELSSTQLEYGLTNAYGTTTAETDTAPRALTHSVTISGLSTCTTYHYRAISTDESSNIGYSSDREFTTGGCPPTGGGSGGWSAPWVTTVSIPTTAVNVAIPDPNKTEPTNTVPTVVVDYTRLCPEFTTSLRPGVRNNQVKLIQEYLNTQLDSKLPLTNFYGPLTTKAIKEFQTLHKDLILTPWNLTTATGIWHTTTRRTAAALVGCPDPTGGAGLKALER